MIKLVYFELNNMNHIPSDIVELIISFVFDRRGYQSIEYHENLVRNRPRFERIKIELTYWATKHLSIAWLRATNYQNTNNRAFIQSLNNGQPKICYHTGVYSSRQAEENTEFY